MDNNKKGNTILLTVIAIATLLVAIVGATFAYFTATVTGNDEAKSVIVSTAQLGSVTYTNGNELKIENGYPGAYSNEITFTVASTNNTVPIAYSINWVIAAANNTFVDKTDLVYSLTGTSSNGGTVVSLTSPETLPDGKKYLQVPASSSAIGTGSLAAGGDTHTYTMQVHFKETADDQNDNQGKSFMGKIEVATSSDNGPYYTDSAKNGQDTIPEAY